MKKRNILSVLFFLILGVVTVYVVFSKNDMNEILTAIKNVKTIYIYIAAAIALFFVSAEGIMIWYLLHTINSDIKLISCIKYAFIGFFFCGITPSASGGQPAQLYYMTRDKIKLSDSSVVLMTVAVIYKFVLVVMGLMVLIFGYGTISKYVGDYMGLYYLGLVLNGGLVVIVLILMLNNKCIDKIIGFCEFLLVKIRILKHSEEREAKIERLFRQYHEAIDFLGKHKGNIAVVILLTILQRCSVFFMTYVVYKGFGLSGSSALLVMSLQAVVYISVDMLPLPGSQGITEIVYQALFIKIFTPQYLVASMCVTRGINFYFLFFVSLVVELYAYVISRKRDRDYFKALNKK